MGQDHPKKKLDPSASHEAERITVRRYNKLGVVGRGGFGKVITMTVRSGVSKAKRIERSTLSNKCPKLGKIFTILSFIQEERRVSAE